MKRWLWVLVVGSLATVALGIGSVFLIDHYSDGTTTDHLARMGTIGDMFGLVGALFSGLGFVGLAAALVFDAQKRTEDLEDRRRARLPFIVPSIDEEGAAIDRAARVRGRLEVDLRLSILLKNLTEEPALDLRLKGEVRSGGDGASLEAEVDNSPLGPTAERLGYVMLHFKGDDAEALVRQLRGQQTPIVMHLTSTYKSLSRADWKSEVDYKFNASSEDLDALAAILDPAAGYTISPPGPGAAYVGANPLFLSATSIPGSWYQGDQEA